MKILEQFTRRLTQICQSKEGIPYNLSVASYLVPDPRHYVSVVYIEVDDSSTSLLVADDSCEELIEDLLQTDGEKIIPLLFQGVQELTSLYCDTYSIPTHAPTRHGQILHNMSTCFVYQKPSAPGVRMLDAEEGCEPNVRFVEMPVQAMTDESLEEILVTHMAAMGQVFDFSQPDTSPLFNMEIPDGWAGIIKTVLNMRDAYMAAHMMMNQQEDMEDVPTSKKWDELTDRQKFMVYRCVVEEMTLAIGDSSGSSDPVMTTSPLKLSVRQQMFKSACVSVASMNMELVRKMVARLEEAEIEKLQEKAAVIEPEASPEPLADRVEEPTGDAPVSE